MHLELAGEAERGAEQGLKSNLGQRRRKRRPVYIEQLTCFAEGEVLTVSSG
jgi:hypothetical protein